MEMQPRGTLRRRGRGMVGEPAWEQERPVSAPAVRQRRRHRRCGLGAASPISGDPVKRVSAERESEWPVVLSRLGTTEPRRREGATLGRRVQRR